MNTAQLVKKYRHVFRTNYTADANCQGAWLFKEGSGDTVQDSSQNSWAGGFDSVGHPAWYNAVLPKTYMSWAVDFTPTDSISMGDLSDIDGVAKMSSTFWYRPDSLDDLKAIIGKFEGAPGDSGWLLETGWTGVVGSSSGLLFATGGNNYVYTGAGLLVQDEWHAYSIVYDGGGIDDDAKCKIYADGVHQANAGGFGGLHTTLPSTALDFLISGENTGSRDFSGKFAESGLFDRPIDSTEINDIIDNGLEGAVGPVAYPTEWLRKNFITGFHCFMNQYLKAKVTGYNPLKLPDGTVF